MIGDPTEGEVSHVNQTEHRQEVEHKKTESEQGMTAPAPASRPQANENEKKQRESQQLRPRRWIERPARVNGQEMRGPEKFAEIKKDVQAGADKPGEEASRPDVRAFGCRIGLEVERDETEQKGEGK